METKLNIAEILKDKPQGTKLYSSACGKCELKQVDDNSFKISFYNSKFGFMNGGEGHLDKFGKLYDDGECVIFPSKEMRDWSKFAWKKGDVLKNTAYGENVIFDRFLNDDYTYFIGKHPLDCSNKNNIIYSEECNCFTGCYSLESEDAAQIYIKTIEERLGGKLNLETLEIEKIQPEFKNGDIVTATSDFDSIFIGVLKKNIKDFPNNELRFYCALENKKQLAFDGLEVAIKAIKTSLATEKEKQLLFSALAMGGKAWDAEKKEIVDLKIKWTPKTFDRVITRDFDDGVWSANIFSHMNSQGEYVSIGCVEGYAYCLPYNEETAKLIGTTNNAK